MTHYRKALAAAALMLTTASLNAGPFKAIRIGDVDGFGFTGDAAAFGSVDDVGKFFAANGSKADTNGNGVIGIGEYLPDVPLNERLGGPPLFGRRGDKVTQATDPMTVLGLDDFDNRSSLDAGNTLLEGSDFIDTGTTGSKFTDVSLSESFGFARVYRSQLQDFIFPKAVYDAIGKTVVPLPFDFPDAPPGGNGATRPNEPNFAFRFSVLKTEINEAQDIFFNMLIGDYDVSPATIELVLNNGRAGRGASVILPLTVQASGQDGLVQGAFATLDFAQVFSDGGSVWDGFLNVRVIAPNEPFLAFDYVELSTQPIFRTPAPAALPLLLLGIAAAALRRRQRAA